jgi:ABC-type Na+ efflux pump permease subunit
MVFRALVWKELKSQKSTYAAVNIVSILIMMPFLVRMTGWGSSLFLIIQVFAGYLFLRESFVGDKQTKTIESLFATPVDGERLWLARVILYGIYGVILSTAIIVSAAAVLNSLLLINLQGLLISPLTFVLLGVAGIILWRVRQSYADIVALVGMSVVALILVILPMYVSAIIAFCLLIGSYRLATDKEAIIMS